MGAVLGGREAESGVSERWAGRGLDPDYEDLGACACADAALAFHCADSSSPI